MPIIKSAKKRMRQNVKRRAANLPFKSKMKTVFKTTLTLLKDGEVDKVKEIMPRAFSVIDIACKKNLIKKNTASRKKSRLTKALNVLELKVAKGAEGVVETKKVKKVEKVAEVA